MLGQVPKWTKGADCKSVAIGFQGSNPCLPTSGKAQVEVKAEAVERALPLNLNLNP
jgi:hypothetical protein